MRAILITQPGGPEVLSAGDAALPVAGAQQVLVRVHATAVNRADLLQRMGRYPPPPGWPPHIPGLEYAGIVEATGPGAERFRAGDRVMGLVGGGAYAEYVAVHQDEVMSVPANLDLAQAAAIPEVFITAHDALLTQAALSAGETLLIHGAGSGVGTAALQIALAVGARALGSARSAWKLERALAMGLDVGIDSTVENFVEVVAGVTGGRGADVILDLVGGNYVNANLRSLAMRGRIVIVGVVAGSGAELDQRLLMQKRASLRGTMLRSRSHDEKAAATSAFAAFALSRFEAGQLQPVIDRMLPMEAAAEAHRLVASNDVFGKVVLRWEDAGGAAGRS